MKETSLFDWISQNTKTPMTVPEALAFHEECLRRYEESCTDNDQPPYSVVEIPKIILGEAVLRTLGLRSSPAPPVYNQRRAVSADSPRYQKQVITAAIRWEVFLRDDFRCVDCGSRRNLSVDHVIPEILGGSHSLDNFRTRCRSCNSKKGTKLLESSTIPQDSSSSQSKEVKKD